MKRAFFFSLALFFQTHAYSDVLVDYSNPEFMAKVKKIDCNNPTDAIKYKSDCNLPDSFISSTSSKSLKQRDLEVFDCRIPADAARHRSSCYVKSPEDIILSPTQGYKVPDPSILSSVQRRLVDSLWNISSCRYFPDGRQCKCYLRNGSHEPLIGREACLVIVGIGNSR
ncbi:hypothetical protein [Chitinimonas koreensis]|uniref:hypothetical protein n=1 Tax=Chitinimonas koreensis TaxID=356302 RepID=UPI0012F979C5|nr:hypothetical protein [Chitinimonas koreensis]QNM98675.1 hypothetical protein H9L41_10895 [Chitinimonas koreensis]